MLSKNILLKNCCFIITQNSLRSILQKKDILIEGTKIKKVGCNLKHSQKIDGVDNVNGVEIVDCSDKIVMPGLINAHAHLGQTLMRGLCDDKELPEWLESASSAESALSSKDVYDATLLGLLESIKSGTTTVFDTYLNLDAMRKAHLKAGLRSFIASSKENDLVLPMKETPLLKTAFSGHSLYRMPIEKLKRIKNLADDNNKLFSMHISETRDDIYQTKKNEGVFPIQYAYKKGLLGSNVLLAHAMWMVKDEISLLSKTGTKLIYNPVSNMKLASGSTLPVPELLEKNVCVSLGTDSVQSNNNLDMFEEMKVAGLLQKYHRWDASALSTQQILDFATINGASALRINCGSIEEGKEADIALLNISERFIPLDEDKIISHIVYSSQGRDVSDVIVAGKFVMRDYEVLTLDEKKLLAGFV